MRRINCIIADDEALARDVIESHLNKIERLHLVAACSNGAEVFNVIKSHPVDLLFLDIQMPHLTGIELLKTLKTPPAVIMTTAYREFALEGYELNVIDYLLKPVSLERFIKAVDKYELWINPGHAVHQPITPKEENAKVFIYVKSDKKMVKILLKDILYIEGLKDYVKIYTTDKPVITYQTLTYFEEKLSADHFARVHRSYIVSLNHISAYSATRVEIGKESIPIGNSYAREALKKLQE